jgi:hypothetical protein
MDRIEDMNRVIDQDKGSPTYGQPLQGFHFDYFKVNNNMMPDVAERPAGQAMPDVYNDAGNVIPLSQRFNPQSDDIRYSIRARDEAYDAAVKSGDEAEQQKLVDEAAREAGATPVFRKGSVTKKGEGGFHFGSELQASSVESKDPTKRYYIYAKNPIRLVDYSDWTNDGLTSQGYSPEASTPIIYLNRHEGLGDRGAVDADGYPLLPDEQDALTDEEFLKLNPLATDSFIIRDPSQIKSADPITHHDAGNVIPLSQRFNPESKDIRFSIRARDVGQAMPDVGASGKGGGVKLPDPWNGMRNEMKVSNPDQLSGWGESAKAMAAESLTLIKAQQESISNRISKAQSMLDELKSKAVPSAKKEAIKHHDMIMGAEQRLQLAKGARVDPNLKNHQQIQDALATNFSRLSDYIGKHGEGYVSHVGTGSFYFNVPGFTKPFRVSDHSHSGSGGPQLDIIPPLK